MPTEMTRCTTCTRWWSFAAGEARSCPCGGTCEAVDMKAHVAALPAHVATHNHRPVLTLKPRGSCEACDEEHASIEKQRKADEAAKKKAAEEIPK